MNVGVLKTKVDLLLSNVPGEPNSWQEAWGQQHQTPTFTKCHMSEGFSWNESLAKLTVFLQYGRNIRSGTIEQKYSLSKHFSLLVLTELRPKCPYFGNQVRTILLLKSYYMRHLSMFSWDRRQFSMILYRVSKIVGEKKGRWSFLQKGCFSWMLATV